MTGFAVTEGIPSYAQPGEYCGLEFLSGLPEAGGHKHPDGSYYSWAALDIRAEFRFDSMEIGQELQVSEGVAISPSVLPTPCGSTYSGVNGGFSQQGGTLRVTRIASDAWEVHATAPASFYEYGGATVFKKGPKGTLICSGNDYGRLIVTAPITTVSVWRRYAQ